MKWAESLPQDCPPRDADAPTNEDYYRLIEDSEPSEVDFYSQRKKYPEKQFFVSECVARAVSVFDRIDSCQKVRKFPTHKNKKMIKILLPEDSGLLKQNGRDISHHSWWRTSEFNPFNYCTVIEA